MKIKKIAALMLSLIIVISAIGFSVPTQAEEDIIEHINEYIKDYYGRKDDFYTKRTSDGTANLDRARKEIKEYGYMLNPLTYGKPGTINITKKGNWSGSVSTIGKDRLGNPIVSYKLDNGKPNEDFYKWKNGWNGKRLAKSTRLVAYDDTKLRAWYENERNLKGTNQAKESYFNSYEKRTALDVSYSSVNLSGEKAEYMEKAIQLGVDSIFAGIKGYQVDNRGKSYKNDTIHIAGECPSGGWLDYVLIVIPPTDISWGVAWRFSKEGNKSLNAHDGGIYYTIEIPIAPFNMVGGDIKTSYVESRSSANPGDEVTFEARCEADFKESKDVSYSWSIKTVSGKPVSVSYTGNGTSESGSVKISKSKPRQFKAKFIMPDEDVTVSFVINGDKKLPESNYENNRAEIDPVVVKVLEKLPPKEVGEFDLDYDIYARKIGFHGANMTASFMNNVTHVGDGYASYNVWSNKPGILQYLSVNANSVVSTNPFSVKPYVQGFVMREGFGDNPGAKRYKAIGIYTEKAQINITGSTWRQYLATFGHAWDYSSFTQSIAKLSTTAKVYNGRESLNNPNTANSSSGTEVKWTSDTIDFDVVRKMYLLDENGNRTNEITVPGKYTRSFVGQNSATVAWSAPKSLAASYAADRATAKKRGSDYINAIFASDKEFEKVPYPIKSGYMFNPAATYMCTVSSSVFCDSEMTEEEKAAVHEQLVKKVINSFVYNNGLQYTKTGTDKYYITNVKNGNESGILKIKRSDNYRRSVYASNSDYETCMEGYAASGTQDSFDNYNYREYVNDASVSRFDAETVITFTISSVNRYTNIGMEDGNYIISAKSNSFSFKGQTVPQQNLNDSITVTVRGSMYDDRN